MTFDEPVRLLPAADLLIEPVYSVVGKLTDLSEPKSPSLHEVMATKGGKRAV